MEYPGNKQLIMEAENGVIIPEACNRCPIEPLCPLYNGCHLCEHIGEYWEYLEKRKKFYEH